MDDRATLGNNVISVMGIAWRRLPRQQESAWEPFMFEAAGAVIVAVIKAGVPIYIAAFIASGLLLFLPAPISQQLGISAFRQMYRPYLGGTFVVSISLLAAYSLSGTSDLIRNRLDDRRLRLLTLETLDMLTSDEKQFLRAFIVGGRNTVNAPISDGIVGGLVAKRLVYRSSNIFPPSSAPYNLQPIARKLLTENPGLLD